MPHVSLLIAKLQTLLARATVRRMPPPFRARTCEGRAWRHAFPCASRNEIREFLSLFASAFVFAPSDGLKLNPRDEMMAVYRGLYPYTWMPDNLEVNGLDDRLRSRYGVRLDAIWHDRLTLGQLFEATRPARGGNP
jgi:propanediol dehydratase small subunit